MKKNSYEQEIGMHSSSRNIKQMQSIQFSNRQNRDFHYILLEQTNFQLYKTEFTSNAEKIRNLRLIQKLGRYIPISEKEAKINEFKILFEILKQSLVRMKNQSKVFKELVEKFGRPRQHKIITFNRQPPFKTKIVKDLKQIQTIWIQLFQEGSLKRIITILNLLNIHDFQFNDITYDISKWTEQVQKNFQESRLEKPSCMKCCKCL